MALFYNKPVVTDNLELYLDAANINSLNPDDVAYNGAAVNAQTQYTTAGTHSFVVPVGVTSISAVAVGGGGGGAGAMFDQGPGAGGGGGGLAYGTFTVTPGETLTIIVGNYGAGGTFGSSYNGSAGGNSQVKRGSTVLLQGGGGGGTVDYSAYNPSDPGSGGTSTGTERDGGGSGGDGGGPYAYIAGQKSGGGGGAGGYSGNGGEGGAESTGVYVATAGSGGGGGGGGCDTNGTGNDGGGVGLRGAGSNGPAGSQNSAGGAGSYDAGGSTYGNGGGGGKGSSAGIGWNAANGNDGSVGAVRLVYLPPTIGNRIYPDGSGTVSNLANTTYSSPTNTWKDLTSSGHTTTLNFSDFNSDNAGSLNFDGTDDYGTFSPGSGIAFGTGQFAIEIWANFVGEGPFYFIDTRNSSQTSSRWALYVNSSEKLEWYTGSTSYFTSDGSMPTWSTGNNGWNHIVFTREGTGSNQFKVYVNSEYKSAVTDTTNYTNSSTEASIGRRYSNAEFFDGKISVFKIYKGKALSASEVLQNYNALKKRYF